MTTIYGCNLMLRLVATCRESLNYWPSQVMAAHFCFTPLRVIRCARRDNRRVALILTAAAMSIFGWKAVYAMEFKVIAPDGGGPALSMSGEILPGDTEQALPWLIRLSAGNIAPRLFLNSPGGNVLEALMLANLIHKGGMPVFVQAGDMCASACFLLFAGSPSRHASPAAMIGVHSASIDGDEDDSSLSMDTALAREARAFGVPPDVIGKMVTTEPSDMAWLTADELHEMDVHTIDATQNEAPASQSLPASDAPKVAVTTPTPPEAQGAVPAPGADQPWDGITYIPAQLAAGDQPPSPPSQPEAEQPTASVTPVHDAEDMPDYVPRGILTAALPDYVPGR